MIELARTHRGFQIGEFTDANGCQCSVQQSSAIDDTERGFSQPGSSYIWLGVDDADPKIMKSKAQEMGLPLPPGEISGWIPFDVPEEVLFTTRMHLHRDQVPELIAALSHWHNTGELPVDGDFDALPLKDN